MMTTFDQEIMPGHQKHTNKIYTRHIHFIYLVEYINHKKRLVDRKGGWKVEFRDA